jgi:DNA-binding Lrp family transcriptional regulator
MQKVKLDNIDRRILQNLQSEGRITNVELSKRAGISAPPCLRRVRALEDAGYIKSYHANLDSKALGYNVTVFAQVGLASQAENDLISFEQIVREWPEVRECFMLAGETDYLLKIVADDWEAYQNFLTAKLTTAENVNHVKSSLTIRTAKVEPGIPINIDPSENEKKYEGKETLD